MAPDLAGDLRGLLALAALLLLPGLLVVRAPWSAVPFLSASFWIVSWGWLPASGRHLFLLWALLCFALLASLRLARPSGATRPGWPPLVVLAAALSRLVPLAFWPVAPGADMSYHSLCALLMTWKDGLPSTLEPLLPVHAFGAGGIGLPGLAADLSLLAGIPAARAVLVVSLAAPGLLHVALYALLARLVRAPSAAVASLAAVAVWQGRPAVLALALAVSTGALLVGGRRRSPAVAAGLFLAAAFESEPTLTTLALSALALGGLLPRAPSAAPSRAEPLAIVALAAALAAAPLLGRGLAPAMERGSAALLLRADAQDVPGPDDLEAIAWLRDHTRPTDVVCNDEDAAGIWIPALAGRGITAPYLPRAYAEELRGRHGRPCAYTYLSGHGAAGPHRGAAVFRNASVSILQNP